MAGARIHKLSSIYGRLTGLLETGTVHEVDKPIWYDVYERHPPKYEPRFDRKVPDVEVKQIFYEEDLIRSKIHQVVKMKYFDLISQKTPSRTGMWVKMCQAIMKEKGVSVDEAIKIMDIHGEQAIHKETEVSQN